MNVYTETERTGCTHIQNKGTLSDQHVDGVVFEIFAGLDEAALVVGPISLQQRVLHEEEGPSDPRQVLSHVFHYGFGTLHTLEEAARRRNSVVGLGQVHTYCIACVGQRLSIVYTERLL